MQPVDSAAFYLSQLTDLLFSVQGFMLLVGYLLIVVLMLVWPPVKWVLISLLIFISSLQVGEHKWIANYQLVQPLEAIRVYARPLTIVLLSTLLFSFFTLRQSQRTRLLFPALTVFMIFQYIVAFRLFLAGNAERWLISTLSLMLIHLALVLVVGRWLQTMQDVYRLLYAIGGGALLIVAMTVYQLVVNPTMIVWNMRLYGISANPQFIALYLAFMLPTVLFLAFGPYVNQKYRPLWIGLASVMVVMLVWTGSRTGFLTAFIGTSFLFYRNYSRLILSSGFLVIIVILLIPFFEGSFDFADRLISTDDTRTSIWLYMMEGFYDNPLLGTNDGSILAIENSYIAVLSQVGLVGFIPLMICGFLLLAACSQVRKIKKMYSGNPMLLDLVIGFWFSAMVAAFFEGYLLGIVTTQIIFVILMGAITAHLIEIGKRLEGHVS